MALFKQVTIVGLGLIGGSLGMALRRRRLAGRVVGLSRRASTVRRARALGAIDAGTTEARLAVRQAEVVVIAVPVGAVVPCAARLAPFMPPGSVLTDVGSAKAAIVRPLMRGLPGHVAFVGGHPIAGSEHRGIEAAEPGLFDGAACILTPTRQTPRRAVRRVTQLWTPLVGQVLTMSPEQHDRLLAGISHLPHLLACCLVRSARVGPLSRAPRSFLDMTRIAKSDPELWDDIFLGNRTALSEAIGRFDQAWRALRRYLRRGDRRALHRLLAEAHAKRDALDGDE